MTVAGQKRERGSVPPPPPIDTNAIRYAPSGGEREKERVNAFKRACTERRHAVLTRQRFAC